jgi:hypothetical protein
MTKELELTLTGHADGYRLAFAGPGYFEEIEVFPTSAKAEAAYHAAKLASEQLAQLSTRTA